MEDQVIQALFQCQSADLSTRSSAENYLNSLKQQPGFHTFLLNTALNTSLPEQASQLASIILKNSLLKWKKSAVPEADKEFIKKTLIFGLKKSVPSKIRNQLEEIAQVLGKEQYPWEGINEQIHGFLDSQDPDQIFAGLTLLSRISKNFEFMMGEKRNRLYVLVDNFFQKLESLFARLLQESSSISFDYIFIICQVFWTCFYIELPESQLSEGVLDSWISKFSFILTVPFDESDFTLEMSSKMNSKKQSTSILYRFFSRYGNPENLIGSSKMIANLYMTKWSSTVLQNIISQLFQSRDLKLPDLLVNSSFKYLNEAVKNEKTREFVKSLQLPNGKLVCSAVITEVITQVLQKTKSDEELWTDNPVEFIRKENDIARTYYSAATAALDLLETLCKHGFLQEFLNYLMVTLNTQQNLLLKEALIHEVGSISGVLIEHEDVKNSIETMLSTHVFSELSSAVHFLRARATWAYGKFVGFLSSPDHQRAVLEKTCTLLVDPELPVKFEAALTIPKLLKWEIAKSRVRDEISNLLQVYLNLVNQIDSEEIIEALEDIVENFDREIIPFAVNLVGQLVVAFLNLSGKEPADDNGDSAMAAVSTLNTIVRLIDTIRESPQDILAVSHSLVRVLDHSLNAKGFEYMEEGLQIFSLLLKYSQDGSLAHLYPFMGVILNSLLGPEPYALEKTEGIFPVLGNFIKKYPNLILNDLPGVIKSALELIKGDKHVKLLGFKLLMSIIENLKESILPILDSLLLDVVQIFAHQHSKRIKSSACQFLFVCIWADASKTIAITLNTGLLVNVLRYSLEQIKMLEDRLPRTRMLIALSYLLPLAANDTFEEDLKTKIFNGIVRLFLLAEEDSESSDEEFIDNKDFDDKCQELYRRIKENLEESDDEPPVLENDADQNYDSMFEEIDYKKEFLEKLAQVPQEVAKHLLSNLEFELKAAFQRIFPEIWSSLS